MQHPINSSLFLASIVCVIASLLGGCANSQDKARSQLKELGYQFTGDDLARALGEKDRRAVSLYMAAKIDPNVVVSKTGCPILSLAILQHETSLVDYMLDAGVDTKTTCIGGLTFPMAAGIEADAPTLEKLGKKGADFKKSMDDGTGVFGIIVNAKGKSEDEKLEALKVAVKYGARPAIGKEGRTALGDSNLAGADLENVSKVAFYAGAKQSGEEKLAAYINSLPRAQGNSSGSVVAGKDCSSSSKMPDTADSESLVKVCQTACDSGNSYACGVAGRNLSGFVGDPKITVNKEQAFLDFQKGCELKDFLTCSETARSKDGHVLLAERMTAYKVECESKADPRACAFLAIQVWDKADKERRAPASDEQFKLGSKSCAKGDALGCIATGMDYVKYINPDDRATAQKWGKEAYPYFKKACDQGWQMGCEMMK